jgi:hypothetical protein
MFNHICMITGVIAVAITQHKIRLRAQNWPLVYKKARQLTASGGKLKLNLRRIRQLG